ncbi:MAG: DotU family type IV/VI secretion system protein [Desulfovermiculus sp.]
MRIVDAFADSFAYVSLLLREPDREGADFETVRTDLDAILAQAADQVPGLDQAHFDAARFAVCAWIDEQLLSSAWPGRNQWVSTPLQKRIYGTVRAGEEFFLRLDQLLTASAAAETNASDETGVEDILDPMSHSVDSALHQVVEVYAACLALGFTGRYYQDAKQRELQKIKMRCLQAISDSDAPLAAERLFPRAYALSTRRRSKWQGILSPGMAALIAGPIVTLAGIYLLYDSMLADMLHNLLSAY